VTGVERGSDMGRGDGAMAEGGRLVTSTTGKDHNLPLLQ
jgi:hypothetical protein